MLGLVLRLTAVLGTLWSDLYKYKLMDRIRANAGRSALAGVHIYATVKGVDLGGLVTTDKSCSVLAEVFVTLAVLLSVKAHWASIMCGQLDWLRT